MNPLYIREESVQWLENSGISNFWAVLLQSITMLILIFLLSWAIGSLAKWIMRKTIPSFIKKTKNTWDDLLFERNVFSILSYYIFGIVFFWLYQILASNGLRFFIKAITGSYFIIVSLMLINAVINTANDIYDEINKNKKNKSSIKIYLQLLKVLIFSLGGIIIISFFADKNFMDILKGLGAMITILLIVYKDTILGFVAGISLSANKMLTVGDWISVPKYHADGTVLDIGLNTVKVQNWDKTISTIPPYALITDSFINWKGMESSGGRRIKRHLNIDIESIHFLSEEDINKFSEFKLLKTYMEEKKTVIKTHNNNEAHYVNQRHLTNVGTFKKYVENYLRSTGFVKEDMTFIVRQLQSNEKGLPIEIYFFCNEQEWATYEQIQADIFDHIFAIVPQFGLRVFQSPSGHNLKSINV